jgi:hypothetical protein
MRKLMLLGAAAGALCWLAATPANAFIPVQSHIIAAKAAQSDVVIVKRERWKHRPAGWSRGKAWWKRGGRGVPPGQR